MSDEMNSTRRWLRDILPDACEQVRNDIANEIDIAESIVSELRAELAALRKDYERERTNNAALQAQVNAFYAGNPQGGIVQRLEAELAALRAERAITASPWRYKEWGGLVVGGGEGSAEVLICTMATNTRHDEGRHNRELIIEAPTLRARLDKAEAEAARQRAAPRDILTLLAVEADACRDMHRRDKAALYESAHKAITRLRAALAQEGGPSGE